MVTNAQLQGAFQRFELVVESQRSHQHSFLQQQQVRVTAWMQNLFFSNVSTHIHTPVLIKLKLEQSDFII